VVLNNTGVTISVENNWIVANGKHGQTWFDGVLLMEITYKSAQDCLNNVNYELNSNPQLQKQFLIEKSLSFVCAEKEFTKDVLKFDSNGLASAAGGLPYQGFFRLATSTEKYSAWFADKKICEIISGELKMQNKNQDLVCP
jgi:hypothetical protein